MKAETKTKVKKELIEWAKSIGIAVVIVFVLFKFVVMPVTVDGFSMRPTLENADRLMVWKLFYTPKQGDIVILSENTGLDEALVKRVIALEGQMIDINEDGEVLVDGAVLEEDYILETISPARRGYHNYPVTVPEGSVFVMGDNRNGSSDSRFAGVGFIDEKEVLGKVLFRLLPLKHFGALS